MLLSFGGIVVVCALETETETELVGFSNDTGG